MNPIVKCRIEHANVKAESNGRIAVITRTKRNPRKGMDASIAEYTYGVQFWTPSMIKPGATSINGDMTTCEFVEILHPTA